MNIAPLLSKVKGAGARLESDDRRDFFRPSSPC
jgi:hypothetical protein